MSDSYPEYLNPFAEDLKPKRKSSIRNSFRVLGKNLRQSFRIHKKEEEEEVTIRQKNVTPQHLPLAYHSHPPPTALPRSRFQERLSRSPRYDSPALNPFEEENSPDIKSTVRRKGKKRAPLPPKSMSSQHINDEGFDSTGGSHWSLTSVETDYSGSVYNPEEKRESMVEKFIDFNKNMNKLSDDSNNNVIAKEDEANSNIPDLVVACPSEEKEVEGEDNKSNVSEELIVKDITNNMKTDETSHIKVEENNEEEPFLYHEKKSLYVAGSRDELNDLNTSYTGRVSLYITGSCDDLDASNNNEVKTVTDENSNDDAVPIPKQRKNKLTKNILLGV